VCDGPGVWGYVSARLLRLALEFGVDAVRAAPEEGESPNEPYVASIPVTRERLPCAAPVQQALPKVAPDEFYIPLPLGTQLIELPQQG